MKRWMIAYAALAASAWIATGASSTASPASDPESASAENPLENALESVSAASEAASSEILPDTTAEAPVPGISHSVTEMAQRYLSDYGARVRIDSLKRDLKALRQEMRGRKDRGDKDTDSLDRQISDISRQIWNLQRGLKGTMTLDSDGDKAYALTMPKSGDAFQFAPMPGLALKSESASPFAPKSDPMSKSGDAFLFAPKPASPSGEEAKPTETYRSPLQNFLTKPVSPLPNGTPFPPNPSDAFNAPLTTIPSQPFPSASGLPNSVIFDGRGDLGEIGKRRVTLRSERKDPTEAIKDLLKSAGASYVLQDDKPVGRTVTFNFNDTPLQDALDAVAEAAGLSYRVRDRIIILTSASFPFQTLYGGIPNVKSFDAYRKIVPNFKTFEMKPGSMPSFNGLFDEDASTEIEIPLSKLNVKSLFEKLGLPTEAKSYDPNLLAWESSVNPKGSLPDGLLRVEGRADGRELLVSGTRIAIREFMNQVRRAQGLKEKSEPVESEIPSK